MMRRIARWAAPAAVGLALLAACQKHVITGPERVAGTFTLATVNSGALPFTLSTAGSQSVRLSAASITLTSGGRFALHETKQTFDNATLVSTAADSLTGTFLVTGDNVILQATVPSAEQYSGTFLNDVLTFDIETNSYRFTR